MSGAVNLAVSSYSGGIQGQGEARSLLSFF